MHAHHISIAYFCRKRFVELGLGQQYIKKGLPSTIQVNIIVGCTNSKELQYLEFGEASARTCPTASGTKSLF